MKSILTGLIIISLSSVAIGQENPLEQLSYYIGTWGPPAGHPMFERNPEYVDLKVIDFQWGSDKRVIWSKTGIYPKEGEADMFSEGMITYNPNTKKFEWLEYEIMNEILFEGEYILLDDSRVQRIYTVYYEENYVGIPYPEREGWTRKFRETFTPTSDNTIDWLTEAWIDGKWIRHGQNGGDFEAVRDQ